MDKPNGLLEDSVLVLVVLSTGFLVFNMVGTLTYQQEVFFEQEAISGVEIVMLIGFGMVLLFDVASVFWGLAGLRQSEGLSLVDVATVGLGVLCPFLLLGEKVTVDEIAREIRLGWEVLGEWTILYILLTIQLMYNLVILAKISRIHRDRRTAGEAI